MSNKKHFVSKYKYSHDERRKAFRKMAKHGVVNLIERRLDGFVYEEVEGISIDISKGKVKVNGNYFHKFIKNHLVVKVLSV